jgi:hypothetical protein
MELRAREFEYRSSLGPRFGATTAANLRTLVAMLRETFPAATFDDRLLKTPAPPDFDVETAGVDRTTETRRENNQGPSRTASFLIAWRLLRPT